MASNRTNDVGSNRPPLCTKIRFANWKVRMQAYMDAIEPELFETVQMGAFKPMSPEPTDSDPRRQVPKLKSRYTDQDKRMVGLDLKAKNLLFMALDDDMFESVINCEDARDVWTTLVTLNEGTNEVRENRLEILIQQYESFTYKESEDISAHYERFNVLLNHLKSYGKIFTRKEINMKFMRTLPTVWDPKTTAVDTQFLPDQRFKTLEIIRSTSRTPKRLIYIHNHRYGISGWPVNATVYGTARTNIWAEGKLSSISNNHRGLPGHPDSRHRVSINHPVIRSTFRTTGKLISTNSSQNGISGQPIGRYKQ